MLDTDTRRRIDTARDILVGKVPDPKSQVEQITIALIYKFMDDMDADSEAMGGTRTFFAGEFARYAWPKLVRAGLGGHDMLNLYAEAIARMPENPGIPLLFRNIFRNAYLPYRDPETLRLFLRVIDEFEYDHSERLGDAFEYLLSVLGAQGDAGQFRTPRHIIDFMVAIIAPQKHETVLDPACGTAGFLISAWKHIRAANRDAAGHSTLTPDENARLARNFTGYDISPDMVRLSRVNLYLHGFPSPQVDEYDTLTSEEHWHDYADIILANPPFMSPKGGIKPHSRFSVQSKRSEVLFVDYIAEHLTPSGRAAVIVPEGIVFQSGTAYKQLREMLVNEYLIGVISLPSGVFMPYTGVKTSILVLDRVAAKHNARIMFSEVRHIGVSLGIKRTPTEQNDLPTILADYRAFHAGSELSRCAWLVPRTDILKDDCSLVGSRYRPPAANGDRRLVALGEVCTITKGKSSSTTTAPGPYPLILTAAEPRTAADYQFEGPAVCVPLISSLGHGKAALHRIHFATGQFALANLLVALQPIDGSELDAKFLFHALDLKRGDIAALMRGAANVSMKPEDLAQFAIPLPPLEVQQQIVAEIEGYQQVIDGARAVLAHYRPHIPIDPAWPLVRLEDVTEANCSLSYGIVQPGDEYRGGLPIVRPVDLTAPVVQLDGLKRIDPQLADGYKRSTLQGGEILLCVRGTTGVASIAGPELVGANVTRGIVPIRINSSRMLQLFGFYTIQSESIQHQIREKTYGATLQQINIRDIRKLLLPLPPLATQRAIVAEIEAEQALVAANRELVARFERKIQATLARVWGEPAAPG